MENQPILHLCMCIQKQPCRPLYIYIYTYIYMLGGDQLAKYNVPAQLLAQLASSGLMHLLLHSSSSSPPLLLAHLQILYIVISVLFVRLHHYHHGGRNAVCTFHQLHFYKRHFLGCQLYSWYRLHWYTHVSNCSRYTIYIPRPSACLGQFPIRQ